MPYLQKKQNRTQEEDDLLTILASRQEAIDTIEDISLDQINGITD
jgi:hypothetical protein